jgi:hypothetical protein
MNPNEPSNHVSTPTVDEIKRQRQKRLENAITPRGSGSGVRREHYTRPSDYELKHCDFKKWTRYDSLPIEQACFVLLGFEPPPLEVLRFQQDTYNPSREPIWDKPQEYDDVLRSVCVSIEHGNISTKRIIEHSYETQHVCWPELIQWARSKSYPIPLELESIVAKIVPVVLAVTVPKLEDVLEPDADTWIEKARSRATEIIKRQRAKGLYPSQVNLSEEIAKAFRAEGIMGTDGKAISGAYIKRHALKGISSAQAKQLSIQTGRSKQGK